MEVGVGNRMLFRETFLNNLFQASKIRSTSSGAIDLVLTENRVLGSCD